MCSLPFTDVCNRGWGIALELQNLKAAQEQEGLLRHTRAADSADGRLPLSKQGKTLLGMIMNAKEWYEVQHLMNKYTGHEIQVFTGAMQKALNLGRYKQGAAIYTTICNKKISKEPPTFTAAITIHSRLKLADAVREIWEEALRTCGMTSVIAAARIRAAASEGDIVTAARILDDVRRASLEINVVHMNSALRACWAADGKSFNAAKFLFYNVSASLDLRPDKITLTNLVGALNGAPVTDFLTALHEVKAADVKPDPVFAETFLTSIFQKRHGERWDSAAAAADRFRDADKDLLEAARSALLDFKANKIKLSTLSGRIDDALQLLASEGM